MKNLNKIDSFEIIKTDEWPEYDLKVTLKPSFKCNHRCWFCEEYNNNTKTWTKEQCDEVLLKLSEIPQSKKRIFFYFYGGEPTLNKHWEYLNYKIIEMFPDKELFLQTHTNLSLSKNRLKTFLKKINKIKQTTHTVNICNSYHIDKQPVELYIEKMDICDRYDSLGYCFFSTEIPKKEKMLKELYSIVEKYPKKLVMKFTEIENLAFKSIKGYEELIKDKYLVGNDCGKSLEYRYWMKYYPELRKYFEEGWNFLVNDWKTMNYSDVKGNNIHKKFKYMKCSAGKKNIVIDHNLNVYRCNDYSYKNLKRLKLSELNFENYLNKCEICLLNACFDGLDFKKVVI
jgi:organic radical activating enzyme